MKRVFLASAGVLLSALVGTAGAADLPRRAAAPVKAPAPAYVAPIYNWTGVYLGLNAGGAWGRSSWDNATSPTGGFNTSGALVGGTLGYNWQANQMVLGLETDLDWTNIRGTTFANCAFGCETKNTWLGTTRARLGYAAGRWMPYVTGGLAYGDIRASTPGFAGANTTKAGWTAGAGLEFALAGNWTAKAEYLYVDLGKFDCGTACGAPAPDNVKFNANIVRAGLNYRF